MQETMTLRHCTPSQELTAVTQRMTHLLSLVIQSHAEHDSSAARQPDQDTPLQLTGRTVIQADRQ